MIMKTGESKIYEEPGRTEPQAGVNAAILRQNFFYRKPQFLLFNWLEEAHSHYWVISLKSTDCRC